jgi:glycosyltransferase involved in cell wall biosynthesis
MKILYLSADPGINVSGVLGGASHIRESVRHLGILGHTVLQVASDGPNVPNQEIPDNRNCIRVKKHSFFQYVADNSKNIPSQGHDPAKVVTTLKKPEKITGRIKSFISAWLYGTCRHQLHRMEEESFYRHRFFQTVKRLIDQEHPDAVYERYALGHHKVFSFCRKKKIPYILEVNAVLGQEMKKNRYVCAREMKFLRRVAPVFVVSEHLKNMIDPENSNIIVNPNGVDIDQFNPDVSAGDVKEKYQLQDHSIIGWVGGFGPFRGIEEFIDIAAEIYPKRLNTKFLIVGDGPLKGSVLKKISQKKLQEAVILTGTVSRQKIPEYIAAMDMALAPYPGSGAWYFSPLKVFEYMAMGKAVAATQMGQCAELLRQGRGLLMPPGNPSLWAERIVDLLDNPQQRDRMGKAARQLIETKYTWLQNTQTIIDQFERLKRFS